MYVGQSPALQSSLFKVSANPMMFGGSSSATETKNGTLDFTSPGKFDRASWVAASGCAPRPLPPPGPPGPRPPDAATAGCPSGCRQAPNPPPAPAWTGGGVAGRMLKAGGDMNTTPLTPTPWGP